MRDDSFMFFMGYNESRQSKTPSLQEVAEKELRGFFSADAVIETWDTRCPICREIFYIEQLVSGPVFSCTCIRTRRRRENGTSD